MGVTQINVSHDSGSLLRVVLRMIILFEPFVSQSRK